MRQLSPGVRAALAAIALLGAATIGAQTSGQPTDQQTDQPTGEITDSGDAIENTQIATNTSPETAEETDMVFVSGEDLSVSTRTSDDLFAAGGTIEIVGASADHLFIAGGEIAVRDATLQDLILAGGEVRLSRAVVADDLIAFGSDLFIERGFDIGDTAVLAGGNVRMEAPVGGDLRIGAGEIYVNSPIAGTARLSGDTIVLGPQARIGGDLLYRTENLVIEPGAVVTGRKEQLPAPDYSQPEDAGREMGRLLLFAGLSILLSYAVITIGLVLAAPGLMRSASREMQNRPWRSFGIGALFAFVVPIFALVLFMSVFGIPLGILITVIAIALTPIAFAVAGYCTGMIARRLATRQTEPPATRSARILWPLLGIVALFLLTLIPFLGIFIWFIAMLFGLGALLQRAGGALSAPETRTMASA
ncbi:hypothetical protein AAV99_12735 [Aurantiacibacter marinus]|uniref:DUF8173 domain-containing protein n=2 Tax=Aurantiacibacter marinus TaxID=874156 RepID=A0A0H0XLQ1_9SPHN|nr:hypothetical protein AAV99_12735 [Aurantiacibacter marinus]